MPRTLTLDALIIGAGFSGIYLHHRLRELNLSIKIVDAGSEPGGTWHFNKYPGARVDCPAPCYAFGIEDVYKGWDWSEMYPDREELREYFRHVVSVLGVEGDCMFGARVVAAEFDAGSARWVVRVRVQKQGDEDEELVISTRYLFPAVGFAAQSYTPPWKGIESFRGEIHHSSAWPDRGVDVRGKRAAVIGTGATGVQIIQEWAKEASETFVFQRTPNLCCPMRQEKFDAAKQTEVKRDTAYLLERCWTIGGGLPYGLPTKMFADRTREEWVESLSELYEKGGFRYWMGAYADVLMHPEGNRLAYDFWAKKTRERIHDPVKRDLLAPLEPPHPFGTKRPCLEQDYYEQFNRPNVHLVSTAASPILEIVPEGIVTEDGKLYEVDAIAIATGFNTSTGSLAQIDIRGVDGTTTLAEKWADGVSTFLGMTVPGFPNMFLPYGAQAPTPFTNGPIQIEFQADWIRDFIRMLDKDGKSVIDTRPEAAKAWGDEVQGINSMTLFPQTKSWYMGANIPGKRVEQLYYLGGLAMYRGRCADAMRRVGECFAVA